MRQSHMESPSAPHWLVIGLESSTLDPLTSDLCSGWSSPYERLLTVTSRDLFFLALTNTHTHTHIHAGAIQWVVLLLTVMCMCNYTLVCVYMCVFDPTLSCLVFINTCLDLPPLSNLSAWAEPVRLVCNISQSQHLVICFIWSLNRSERAILFWVVLSGALWSMTSV